MFQQHLYFFLINIIFHILHYSPQKIQVCVKITFLPFSVFFPRT